MLKKNLEILQVYKDFYPPVKGGIECHINLLSRALKEYGINVRVLASNTTNKFQIDTYRGIEVFKAPQWGRLYSAPLTLSFAYYLRRFGKSADIIHFHHPNPTAEFSYFFCKLKRKLIVTYHSDIIRQDKLGKLYSPIRKLFLQASDKIIATSLNYINTSSVLKNFEHKCAVIPLGVDIDKFHSNINLSKIKQIKKENGPLPIILFVGRFRYYKGLHILIPAMKKIQAKLLLIGAGEEEKRLRKLVEIEHLSDKVCFLGELSDEEVNSYYHACDIFVLPSHLRSEAFGMVLLEAMSCKKPALSTELGTGTTFVNKHQQTGITVQPNDIESLTAGIKYLINHPEKRKSFGEFGYRRARKLFTAKKMVEETLKLYEEVMNA